MKVWSFLASVALLTGVAQAGPFTEIRIGDVDGLGFGSAAGLFAANGGSANVDGLGVLAAGDFIPDLNRDNHVATGSGDDFDLRSAAEKQGHATGGSGYSTAGSSFVNAVTGSQFTDISLSTSFDATFGTPNDFPLPPSTTLSNQPGFGFDFFVASADIANGTNVFFNMVFGDYDVSPAVVLFTRADGSTFTRSVSTQAGGQDGLIQARFATLAFGDVFTAVAGGYQGFLLVDFDARREPYTAFDYVELSVKPISTDPPSPVPEPGTFVLCALGAAGLAWRRRRAQ